MLRLTGRQVESLFDQLLPVEVRELLATRSQRGLPGHLWEHTDIFGGSWADPTTP